MTKSSLFSSYASIQEPVPVVSDSVIARCRRCRTYINPFVTFVEGGQRWKCNMCFLLNDGKQGTVCGYLQRKDLAWQLIYFLKSSSTCGL
jgi:hypothetical protein